MDLFHNLVLGLGVALTLQNVAYAFVGCMIGTLIGVLPGIGPVATIAMLLPITFHLPPTAALIMLAGIYYGAQYGGSTTSILVNLPGEASSVVTCIDGYQMAKRGRAGAALSISAIGSFVAGTVGTIVIVLFAGTLTQMAQSFGPAEYCSLMALGLIAAVVLANGSILKAVAMVFLGLLFGLAGTDINTGAERFTFGVPQLSDGIDFAPIAMGLFGIAEIVVNFERRRERSGVIRVGSLWPTRQETRRACPAIVRGTLLGSILGVLPGGGATLGAFAAYTLEKKISRYPDEFGKGAIEGVAGPESANNAAA
jgi:putative tricarboxylic transport membrane protein